MARKGSAHSSNTPFRPHSGEGSRHLAFPVDTSAAHSSKGLRGGSFTPPVQCATCQVLPVKLHSLGTPRPAQYGQGLVLPSSAPRFECKARRCPTARKQDAAHGLEWNHIWLS